MSFFPGGARTTSHQHGELSTVTQEDLLQQDSQELRSQDWKIVTIMYIVIPIYQTIHPFQCNKYRGEGHNKRIKSETTKMGAKQKEFDTSYFITFDPLNFVGQVAGQSLRTLMLGNEVKVYFRAKFGRCTIAIGSKCTAPCLKIILLATREFLQHDLQVILSISSHSHRQKIRTWSKPMERAEVDVSTV